MRARSWAVASMLMAALWSSPRIAAASEQPVGVGPIEYSGEFPAYFQREIEQTFGEAIERAHTVAVELRVKSCTQLDCLRGPAARAKVAVVIMPRVIKDDRDYRVEITAYAVDDGQAIAAVELECSVCGQRELLDAIPAKVIELKAEIAEALAARTRAPRLAVDGTPSGAALSLDGRDAGVGPASFEVTLGEHELEIDAPGHAAQVHRWVAVAGVEELVSYELTPLRASGQAPRGLAIGGWIAVSLGVAGTGAGIALLVLDGREHGPTCDPELVDVNGACPNVYTTASAGYVGLAIGLATVAAGAGLLIHHRRRTKDARVGLTPGGLSVRF